MEEVTTFKDGDSKVEFDGKKLIVHFNTYNSKEYKSLNEAIMQLGSLLGMATKAVATYKDRAVEQSRATEKPLNLDDIPF